MSEHGGHYEELGGVSDRWYGGGEEEYEKDMRMNRKYDEYEDYDPDPYFDFNDERYERLRYERSNHHDEQDDEINDKVSRISNRFADFRLTGTHKINKDGSVSDTVTPYSSSSSTKTPSIVYKFKPRKELPKFGACVFVGQSETGKTSCIHTMMRHAKDFYDIVFCFVGTSDTAREYRKHIPDLYIHCALEVDYLLLCKVVIEQEERRERGEYMPRTLIIFDDTAFGNSLFNRANVIAWLFKNGRHSNFMIYVSTQYYTDLAKGYRLACKVAFLQRTNLKTAIEALYESYNSCFEGFRQFRETFLMCTKDYSTLVMFNKPTATEFEDLIRWSVNDPVGSTKFKMCEFSGLWEYAAANTDDKYHEKKEFKDDKVEQLLGGLPDRIKKKRAQEIEKNASLLGTKKRNEVVHWSNVVVRSDDFFDPKKHKKIVKRAVRQPLTF